MRRLRAIATAAWFGLTKRRKREYSERDARDEIRLSRASGPCVACAWRRGASIPHGSPELLHALALEAPAPLQPPHPPTLWRFVMSFRWFRIAAASLLALGALVAGCSKKSTSLTSPGDAVSLARGAATAMSG